MSRYKAITVVNIDAIDWVSLNRPDCYNALNKDMIEELRDYFGNLYNNTDVRVVILKGAGKGFCAGWDIKSPGVDNLGPAEGIKTQRDISEIILRMRRCPQPIISLLHGPVVGAGLALALASDIRFGGESVKMNAAFILIGLTGCDVGVSYFLPRLVGSSIAAEMMMTGRFFSGERALRVGLISELLPDSGLDEAAQSMADDMIATSPLGLRLTKEGMNANLDAPSLESAIMLEDRQQVLCFQNADYAEGLNAFRNKRKPRFRQN